MTTLRSLYSTEPAFGAYSKSIETSFAIPALTTAGTQKFDNVSWVSVGQSVFLGDGYNWGYFLVTEIDEGNNTLTLKNEWGLTTGLTIAVGAKLSPGGYRGLSGPQGIQGVKGEKGDKGDQGEKGIQGEIGLTGPQGVQGIQGEKGELDWIITDVKTSNYTSNEDESVPCDTTLGGFNITLPSPGNRVRVFDAIGVNGTGGFAANSVTVLPSAGTTVMGDTSLELDLGGSSFEFELIGNDWRVVDGIVPIQEQYFGGDYSQLTGLPTLGTAAATDATDYATAAQGALADTALQPADNETISGDYTFNGALILPNNSRINGVEHFYQTTKPTARADVDNPDLVIGDRWWKTDDGTEWFWNGTYWLSAWLNHTPFLITRTINATQSLTINEFLPKNSFIVDLTFSWESSHDSSNYITFTATLSGAVFYGAFDYDTRSYSTGHVDVVVPVSVLAVNHVLINLNHSFTEVGNTTLYVTDFIRYREAYL